MLVVGRADSSRFPVFNCSVHQNVWLRRRWRRAVGEIAGNAGRQFVGSQPLTGVRELGDRPPAQGRETGSGWASPDFTDT